MKNILLLLCFSLFTISYAQTNQKNFLDKAYIEVSGKVEKELVPDEIYIHITINENDIKGKFKVEDKEVQMINALQSLGIKTEEKLSILNFSGGFRKYLLKKNKVVKYKNYQLLIHNANQLGPVFQTLDVLGISNVYIAKVSHSKIEEIRFSLKMEAIKIAKKKAIAYAEAISQSIGKALLILELKDKNYNNAHNYSNIVFRGTGVINKNTSNIGLQKIVLTASVEAKFELK